MVGAGRRRDAGRSGGSRLFRPGNYLSLARRRAESTRKAVWTPETGQEWSGTRLAFELEAQGATTLVRFTHAGWARASDYFVSCNTTWGGLMFRLKAAAEGRAPGLFSLRIASHTETVDEIGPAADACIIRPADHADNRIVSLCVNGVACCVRIVCHLLAFQTEAAS
jgi:hypothetical protein